MAGRKAAIEGQLLWTVDGEDDVEASGKAAEKTVKGAGDAAKGASKNFDSWLDKVLELNEALDQQLNENVQGLFKATDRLNSIFGAVNGAMEIGSRVAEGLAWAHEQLTGAQEKARRKAEQLEAQLQRQTVQAKLAADAMRDLSAASGAGLLDADVDTVLNLADAQRDAAAASEALNVARANLLEFEKGQSFDGFLKPLAAAGVETEGVADEIRRLDAELHTLSTTQDGIANRNQKILDAFGRREQLLQQRARLQAVEYAAELRFSDAAMRVSDILGNAAVERAELEARNAQTLQEAADAAKKGAKVAEGAAASFETAFETAIEIGQSLRDRLADIANGYDRVAGRAQLIAGFEEQSERLFRNIVAGAQAAGEQFGETFGPDLDAPFHALQERTAEIEASFERMYTGIGEGAAAALVDMVVFGESAKAVLNDLANAALQEAAVGFALESAKALVQLAIGNFPGAAAHGKAAAAYLGVSAVAGAVAAASGGVGGGSSTGSSSAPTSPPRDFRRRDERDTAPGETIINVNYIAGRRPATRRERYEFQQDTRRAARGQAA